MSAGTLPSTSRTVNTLPHRCTSAFGSGLTHSKIGGWPELVSPVPVPVCVIVDAVGVDDA